MIEIDGSAGEGGGQILRTSLALAMCTSQGFTLTRIRAGRAKPGLMRQHLACVLAAAEISGARTSGAELGSQALAFEPGPVRAGDYSFAVGSAGSCTLVLQTVWPALMLADATSTLRLCGGTHNPMAPPFHFLERSFAPLLRRLGANAELSLRRLGFYPAGGGEIDVTVHPAADSLAPFDLLERGALHEAWADCLAPGLPRTVAQRELEHLGSALGWQREQLRVANARQNEGPGNALLATLVHEHVCEVITSFGEKSASADRVAGQVVAEVLAWQAGDGALGEHLADQWSLPIALAVWKRGGAAAFTCTALSDHATTNFATIERFLPVRFATEARGRGWKVTVMPAA
ncbi:MAG: RNA 3'-terminal phosphate cyclase [Betaproteobacteria bacterium]